jgi:predicted dehydrogenase
LNRSSSKYDRAVGVALIGTGMWGWQMAEALRRNSALRLFSCFRRRAERPETLASPFRRTFTLS